MLFAAQDDLSTFYKKEGKKYFCKTAEGSFKFQFLN